MRVLIVVLACRRLEARLRAVLDTWAGDVPQPHAIAFFADDALAATMEDPRVWPCIEAGSRLDSLAGIPVKLRAGLQHARTLPWDWLVKADDDSYVHVERLLAHLQSLDASRPLYVGNALGWSAQDANCAELVPLAGRDFCFHWGFGLAVSRPAFDLMWPVLEVSLCRSGERVDDKLMGAVAARCGIPCIGERSIYTLLGGDGILRSGGAIGASFESAAMREVHQARRTRVLPTIVSARTGWGHVGLGGWLGFDDAEVRVAGREHPTAISAHAPSRVVVRRAPGERLLVQGSIADTSRREGASADFRIETADGGRLADLGRARRLMPTMYADVQVPGDGLLALVAEPDQTAWCHSVWLLQ